MSSISKKRSHSEFESAEPEPSESPNQPTSSKKTRTRDITDATPVYDFDPDPITTSPENASDTDDDQFYASADDAETLVDGMEWAGGEEYARRAAYLDDDEMGFDELTADEGEQAPSDPETDLVMVPADSTFQKYSPPAGFPPINGRICVLKFNSSPARHIWWLQSPPINKNKPNRFSARDTKIIEIVDRLLQGEEVDVTHELDEVVEDDVDSDEDDAMEDADAVHGATGGAGADATGGDVREEGEEAREGGADGARAPLSESQQRIVADFAASFARGTSSEQRYPSLNYLLKNSTTTTVLEGLSEEKIEKLFGLLPPPIALCAMPLEDPLPTEPSEDLIEGIAASLSTQQKKELLNKVLCSTQFSQSLTSLTLAIREGGLPTVAEALSIEVEHGGYMGNGAGMPEGGDRAIKLFVDGVRTTVKKEPKEDEAMEED